METTKLVLNSNKVGELQLYVDDVKAGKMDIAVQASLLVIYHTEVDEAFNGRGYAKILLTDAVKYAREKGLKIAPLCPFVFAQFKRHPDQYQDIWHQRNS